MYSRCLEGVSGSMKLRDCKEITHCTLHCICSGQIVGVYESSLYAAYRGAFTSVFDCWT